MERRRKRKVGRPATGCDPVVPVRVPSDILARLDQEARATKANRSTVMRRALARSLPELQKPVGPKMLIVDPHVRLTIGSGLPTGEVDSDVGSLNGSFPQFPVTIRDKGWVYGVWYRGTAYKPVALHGQYPPTFLKRALALFPDVPKEEILHCPSGTVRGPGVTVDAIRDRVRKPQFQADVASLPFPDHRFSLILSDPPYSDADSKIYGCKKPWPMRKAMLEFHRVLKPGGYLGMLHTHYPHFTKTAFALKGLIAVVCGAGRATRMFSLFERLPR